MANVENRSKIVQIEIDKIDLDPNHPRETKPSVEELAHSMKTIGQLHPAYVVPDEERYTLVLGKSRYEAARVNKQPTLDCIILTDREKLVIFKLDENLMRHSLDPLEEGKGFEQLAKNRINHAMIAKRYGRSRTEINQAIGLRRIPEALRATIRTHCQNSDTKVAREALYIISRQDGEKMEAVWEIYLDGGVAALRAMEKPEKEVTSEPAKKKPTKQRFVERINDKDWGVTIRANGARPDPHRVVKILEKALEKARAKAAEVEGEGDNDPTAQ